MDQPKDLTEETQRNYEDGRKYDTGDVVGDLEVVGVSYQENEDNGRYNFTYQFKPKAEVDAARKAEKEHQKEMKRLQEEAEEQAKREAEEEAAHRNEA